tara:strand:+ start:1879 stop:2658 length:780 start_codon:yes stop_codon:yes gene_type:complete
MITVSLTASLKKLRLSGMIESYDIRAQQARDTNLSHTEWLELILQEEIQRRDNHSFFERLKKAHFEEDKTLESFDMSRYPLNIQHLIRDLAGGSYTQEKRGVLIVGPTGIGKSHLGQALGHQACRQGKQVKFIRASQLFRDMYASRADQSWEKILKRLAALDLLIIDDFGLTSLTFIQAEDLYEIIAQKHQRSSLIFTSNRKIESWVELFPDAAMGHAAFDRLVSQSHVVMLEGDSYRRQLSPHNATQLKEENSMKKNN